MACTVFPLASSHMTYNIVWSLYFNPVIHTESELKPRLFIISLVGHGEVHIGHRLTMLFLKHGPCLRPRSSRTCYSELRTSPGKNEGGKRGTRGGPNEGCSVAKNMAEPAHPPALEQICGTEFIVDSP